MTQQVRATRTANKLDLLYFALVCLLFYALNAFRKLLQLGGVRFPALVDLCDGATVEIRDGL
jgi:hypothetical protein